jgi:ammonium transporter, Amt family
MTTRGLGAWLLGAAVGSFCLVVPAVAQESTGAPAGAESPLNNGDVAWMLTSSALVLMMTGPGLALFYSGLVRKKNVLGTMAQSFAMMAIITLQWYAIGYSLAFHEGVGCGGAGYALLNGVSATQPDPAYPPGAKEPFQYG